MAVSKDDPGNAGNATELPLPCGRGGSALRLAATQSALHPVESGRGVADGEAVEVGGNDALPPLERLLAVGLYGNHEREAGRGGDGSCAIDRRKNPEGRSSIPRGSA